jgi:hypothetical protein
MWPDVLRRHQESPMHLMAGGGDQLYNDDVWQVRVADVCAAARQVCVAGMCAAAWVGACIVGCVVSCQQHSMGQGCCRHVRCIWAVSSAM